MAVMAITNEGQIIRSGTKSKYRKLVAPFDIGPVTTTTYSCIICPATKHVFRGHSGSVRMYDGMTVKDLATNIALADVSADGSAIACISFRSIHVYVLQEVEQHKYEYKHVYNKQLLETGALYGARFSYDNQFLYVSYAGGVIMLNLNTLSIDRHMITNDPIIDTIPTYGTGLITTHDSTITLWRRDYGLPVMRFSEPMPSFHCVSTSATKDGIIYSTWFDHQITAWNNFTDKVEWRTKDETSDIGFTTCMRLNRDDSKLYIATTSGIIHVVNCKTGEYEDRIPITDGAGIADFIIL